jgi:hypothetical protein
LGQRDTGIACTVIDVEGISVGMYGVSTREHDVMHVASMLIVGLRTEDP